MPTPRVLAPVPPAVRALIDALAAAGHEAYLVGGCVRDLLVGRPVNDFDLATSAAPDALLALFPTAVPIGIRYGTVMVPTEIGPVDVTTFRAGPRIEDDLSHRDFTLNALAYDPRGDILLDPHDGWADLRKHRLRAVRSAHDRFREDPLRALRAARLIATLELEPDPDLEPAMASARRGLRGIARQRVGRELALLLVGPGVGEALALLRRTGIERDLAAGTAPDAEFVVPALPPDLDLRLAAWLRGTRAGFICRELRFPRRVSARVAQLVRHHPIALPAELPTGGTLRRLIKLVREENIDALIALRRSELVTGVSVPGEDRAAAERRLGDLETLLAQIRRTGFLALRRLDLAIDGEDVMGHFGWPPGPPVGRALAYLTDRIVEDPSLNTPAALRDLLDAWAREP